jgi:hypothetical protein
MLWNKCLYLYYRWKSNNQEGNVVLDLPHFTRQEWEFCFYRTNNFFILELFPYCGIFFSFWNCSHSVVFFVAILKSFPVWYFSLWKQFQNSHTKNTTLLEQFKNGHNFFLPHYGNNSKMARKIFHNMEPIPKQKNKKYHSMETIPKWKHIKYHTMGTIPKWKKYHTGNDFKMATKNTTLWEQFQNEKKIPQYG